MTDLTGRTPSNVSAFGGGGGASGPVDTDANHITSRAPPAPTSISYGVSLISAVQNVSVFHLDPVVRGGRPTSFLVNPALPAGISLDPVSGRITVQRPPNVSALRSYQFGAVNGGGGAATHIDVEVTADPGSGTATVFKGDLTFAQVGSNPDIPTSQDLAATAVGLVGGPFSPTSQIYSVINLGGGQSVFQVTTPTPWLTLSGTTDSNLAPQEDQNFTVAVNANANALIAGVYVGTVTVQNLINGLGNITFDFTLTINNAPDPGRLSVTPADDFNSLGDQAGPFTPATKVYTLTNPGGVSINYSVGRGLLNGWLLFSTGGAPASSISGSLAPAAVATVTVSYDTNVVNELSAGIFTDTITFTNTTNGTGTTTRGNQLTVIGSPGSGNILAVSPSSGFGFSGPVGGPFTPTDTTYAVRNDGINTLLCDISSSRPEVVVSPTSVSVGANGSANVTVTTNAGALGVGVYPATLVFQNRLVPAQMETRTGSIAVTGGGGGAAMSVAGGTSWAFTAIQGSQVHVPPSASWTVTNTGTASMNYTVALATFPAYASFMNGSGTLAPGASVVVQFRIDSATLPQIVPGTYNDTLVFTNTTNGVGNTSIPGSLVVSGPQGPATLKVSPVTDFAFTGPAGGPFTPTNVFYVLSNTGSNSLTYSTTINSNLSLSSGAASGSIAAGAFTILGFTVSATGLGQPIGTYVANLIFTNITNGRGTTTRAGQLVVTDPGIPGTLVVSPATTWSFTSVQGTGVTSPSSFTYDLSNSGNTPLDYTVVLQTAPAYATITPSSGTIVAGGSTTVTLMPVGSQIAGLPIGVFLDILVFTNTTNGNGNTTRNGGITISAPPINEDMVVFPDGGDFTKGYVQDKLGVNLYGSPTSTQPFPIVFAIEHAGPVGGTNTKGRTSYGRSIRLKAGRHSPLVFKFNSTSPSTEVDFIDASPTTPIILRGEGIGVTKIGRNATNANATVSVDSLGNLGHTLANVHFEQLTIEGGLASKEAVRIGQRSDNAITGIRYLGWWFDFVEVDGAFNHLTSKGPSGIAFDVADVSGNGYSLFSTDDFRFTSGVIHNLSAGNGFHAQSLQGDMLVQNATIHDIGGRALQVQALENSGGQSGLRAGVGTVTFDNNVVADVGIDWQFCFHQGAAFVFPGRHRGHIKLTNNILSQGFDTFTAGLRAYIETALAPGCMANAGQPFGVQALRSHSTVNHNNYERSDRLTVANNALTFCASCGTQPMLSVRGFDAVEIKDNAITAGNGQDSIQINFVDAADPSDPNVLQWCVEGNTISSAFKIGGVTQTQPQSFAWLDCGGLASGPDTLPVKVSNLQYPSATVTLIQGTAITPITPTYSGGTPSATFLEKIGTLPPGLSFVTAQGQIAGTPVQTGTFVVVLRAENTANVPTDSDNEFQITFTVNASTSNPPPALGTGLNTLSHFDRMLAFKDAMKSSERWQVLDSMGNFMNLSNIVPVFLDGDPTGAQGYPDFMALLAAFPTNTGAASILYNNTYQGTFPSGKYVITWDGQGGLSLRLTGMNQPTEVVLGNRVESTVPVPQTNDSLYLRISSSVQTNPVRNIKVWTPGTEPGTPTDTEPSEFHPLFIAKLLELRPAALRFNEWSSVRFTSGAADTWFPDWSKRKLTTDVRQTFGRDRKRTGVSVNHAINLCNRLGCHMWWNVPHRTDGVLVPLSDPAYTGALADSLYTSYVTSLATEIKNNLSPSLIWYVELSNEAWNPGFPINPWVTGNRGATPFNQFLAGELNKVFAAITTVYSTQLSRVKRTVMGWIISSKFLSDPATGAQGVLEFLSTAVYDAVGCAAYFNVNVGVDIPDYNTRISGGENVLPSEVVADASKIITQNQGSVASIATGLSLHKTIADLYGKELLLYETADGIFFTGVNPPCAGIIRQSHRDPTMFGAYDLLMRQFSTYGVKLAMHSTFIDNNTASTDGSHFALLEFLGQATGTGAAPKWDRWIQGAPPGDPQAPVERNTSTATVSATVFAGRYVPTGGASITSSAPTKAAVKITAPGQKILINSSEGDVDVADFSAEWQGTQYAGQTFDIILEGARAGRVDVILAHTIKQFGTGGYDAHVDGLTYKNLRFKNKTFTNQILQTNAGELIGLARIYDCDFVGAGVINPSTGNGYYSGHGVRHCLRLQGHGRYEFRRCNFGAILGGTQPVGSIDCGGAEEHGCYTNTINGDTYFGDCKYWGPSVADALGGLASNKISRSTFQIVDRPFESPGPASYGTLLIERCESFNVRTDGTAQISINGHLGDIWIRDFKHTSGPNHVPSNQIHRTILTWGPNEFEVSGVQGKSYSFDGYNHGAVHIQNLIINHAVALQAESWIDCSMARQVNIYSFTLTSPTTTKPLLRYDPAIGQPHGPDSSLDDCSPFSSNNGSFKALCKDPFNPANSQPLRLWLPAPASSFAAWAALTPKIQVPTTYPAFCGQDVGTSLRNLSNAEVDALGLL